MNDGDYRLERWKHCFCSMWCLELYSSKTQPQFFVALILTEPQLKKGGVA